MRIPLLFVVILLGLVQLSSAVSLSLEESYAQQETFVAEIEGVIVEPIVLTDVEFLRGHVAVSSFEYNIQRLGDRTFLYAITPATEHNYTLIIHSIETFVNGQRKSVDLVHNFSVRNDTAPYTIRPGFMTTNTDFIITITLNEDTQRSLELSYRQNSSILLRPGENNVPFEIEEFTYGLQTLHIGPYAFPIHSTYASEPISPPRILHFTPTRIEEHFLRSSPTRTTFIITNRAERELSGFTFEYNKDRYELKPSTLKRLKANETATFNLTLLSYETHIADRLRIRVDDEEFELPLEMTITNETGPKGPGSVIVPAEEVYTCNELNGIVCLAAQQCSGETVTSQDGACCRGTCVTVEEKTGLAWLGYLIGAAVVFILLILLGRYLKHRSKVKKENPLSTQIKKLEKPY